MGGAVMTDMKKPRGFAALSQEQRYWVSSRGVVAVQAQGRGHQWTPGEARAAGRLGGLRTQARKRVGGHAR